MTLLSDIVRALHDADVAAYSVQTSVRAAPSDPDLIVIIDASDEDAAADVLNAGELPIAALKRVSHGVIHVWQRQPVD